MSDKIPQRIMDEAMGEFPPVIWFSVMGDKEDVNEGERNAYIAGRMKSDGELAIEFSEWINMQGFQPSLTSNNWQISGYEYTTPELYAIFLQSKQNK